MFGYIIANISALNDEQKARYRGCYCGLCEALKERHGELSRMTLNFDMTFLVILLSSMYEPAETTGSGRCVVHPLSRHSWWRTEFTDYAADMNVALAYYNCLDDWHDERKVLRYTQAKLLEPAYSRVKENWPRQCEAIEQCMQQLSNFEKSGSSDPDAAANSFAVLMGELFACRNDSWTEHFRNFGQKLGRFIYMLDACVDIEKDKKHGRYNPLAAMEQGSISEHDRLSLLKTLIGECVIEFEHLPVLQDVDIMRNILYSGVWYQYELAKKKRGDTEDDK